MGGLKLFKTEEDTRSPTAKPATGKSGAKDILSSVFDAAAAIALTWDTGNRQCIYIRQMGRRR
ncbi:MAG: hypothetical protein WDN75_18485 [Bacteroidota bacterium]